MSKDRTFHGVSIVFEEHWAHITTNQALFDYLERQGKKDASHLASYLKVEYKNIYRRPLDISINSLAIEILIHAYLDKLVNALQKAHIPKVLHNMLAPLLAGIGGKTAVIDCGEICVDANRAAFNGLEPFAPLVMSLLDQ